MLLNKPKIIIDLSSLKDTNHTNIISKCFYALNGYHDRDNIIHLIISSYSLYGMMGLFDAISQHFVINFKAPELLWRVHNSDAINNDKYNREFWEKTYYQNNFRFDPSNIIFYKKSKKSEILLRFINAFINNDIYGMEAWYNVFKYRIERLVVEYKTKKSTHKYMS